jgi:hypothetical protein
MPGDATLYVVDTSSLIEMKWYYPISIFESLWMKCETLMHNSRMCAPVAVFDELNHKDDELTAWARGNYKYLFQECTDFQVEMVHEILSKFPKLIDPNRETEQADPFVVALGLERRDGPQKSLVPLEVVVVSQERLTPERRTAKKKVIIPEVCRHYNLPCITLIDMIAREGWKF